MTNQPVQPVSVCAPDKGAKKARSTSARHLFGLIFAGLVLSGCSALPDKPVRAVMYDFGPGALTTQASTRQARLAPLAIDDIATSGGALDNMAVLYRLSYIDAHELRPYSQALANQLCWRH